MLPPKILNKIRLVLLALLFGCIAVSWFHLLPPPQTLLVQQRFFPTFFVFLFVLEAQTAPLGYRFQLFLAALLTLGGAFLPLPWRHLQEAGIVYGGILLFLLLLKKRRTP